jgi:hypothetical protein
MDCAVAAKAERNGENDPIATLSTLFDSNNNQPASLAGTEQLLQKQ